MFFAISKIGWYLVQPLVIILLFLGAGLLFWFLRMPRTGATLLVSASVILLVISVSPLGILMMSVLENRFPRPDLPERITGIVVLGGSFDTKIARTRNLPELNEAADRVTTVLTLARRYPEARVIFTGGSAAMLEEDIAETDIAREIFPDLGLEPSRLELEDQARNTEENARYSRAMAHPKPGDTWLLVTSAYHMPRAVGCFRQAGFEVLPYPTDYQTPGGSAAFSPSTATIRNLEKVHFAIREYLGLAAYRLTGKTDALFPSPAGTALAIR
ncbi:YdcF family protein [Aureimonas sp. AU4]|uniref:YdcF family protein n=1 Tax=Aureimonas sp. AU4 TaxID=1638163 RepID=UPI000785839F|nr:YdcF family protein [Aureimonas sp. AU4]